MPLTAIPCALPWQTRQPQASESQPAHVAVTRPTTADRAEHSPRATLAQRAIFLAGRTVRQIPAAMFNVACNVGFQSAALTAAKKLNAKATIALPWGASLAGHIGVSASKELVGELAELLGPRLSLPGTHSRWWPYSTQALIARLSSGISDAGFYTLGVVIGSEAGKAIRKAHGTAQGASVGASQELMKILQELGNGELVAFLGPNGACDWGHRITEAFIIVCMPDASYDFQFCRKPEWKNFLARFGAGMFSRVVITGLSSSAWLKSIASENQAGYMVAGAYSALVPAALRVAQPVIRDMLYQAHLNQSGQGERTRLADEEVARTASVAVAGENTGDFIAFHPGRGDEVQGMDGAPGHEMATLERTEANTGDDMDGSTNFPENAPAPSSQPPVDAAARG